MLAKPLRILVQEPVRVTEAGTRLQGRAKSVRTGDTLAGGEEIPLARDGGRPRALDNRCRRNRPAASLRVPLAEGRGLLRPRHDDRFDPCAGREFADLQGEVGRTTAGDVDGNAEVDL